MRSVKSRLFGTLAVAVLGVLAFATSAQAISDALESGFFINEAQVGALKATVTGKQVGRGTLLIPALKVEINCEKFSMVKGVINSTTVAEVELLYEECTVLTNEGAKLEEAFGCEIVTNHEGGVQKHDITASAISLPAEIIDGSPAVLAENILAKVLTKPESGCLLPKTTEIKGDLCIDFSSHSVTLAFFSALIQSQCMPRLALKGLGGEINGTEAEILELENKVPPKAFLDKLLFGTNEAFIDGEAEVFLTGAHAGKTLGVLLI